MEQTKIPQCYKQTSIGIIPEDWEVKRIDEIAPLQRGFDLPMNNIVSGNHPVVFSNGILKFHNEFKAKAPGIVTGRSGTIGKVFYITEDYWPHNTSLWVTNFIGSKPKYVFYLFNYLNFNRFGSGSGVPTLNRNDIHPYKIPLPPLPEQQKIAEILSTWDKAIELCQKTIEELKQRNKGLAQQLLSGKKRVKSFEDSVWKKEKLRNITKIVKGEQLNSITLESYGEYPSYSGGINPSGYTNKFNTEKNTIIISEGGNSCGFVNFIDVDFWSGGHCYSLPNASLSKHIDKKFLFYYLKNNENLIMNLRVGSGLPNVQKKDVENFQIAHPSLEEQKRIVSILDTAASELKHYEEKLTNLKLQKKGLMQQLLTGKVRTV